MAIADAPLTISDAARVTGLSAHTLRYYERAGLMMDVDPAVAATAATATPTSAGSS